MGTKTAVGYLRKSRVTSDRHVSWEVQEQAVRELAARHGDVDLEILSDWNRSGRGDKTALRAGYTELCARVESGAVSAVYSYSLSRLARSLTEYARLAELCRDQGTAIRLAKEGEFDYATPSGRLIVGILALFAQMEAELAQERARDTVAIRRARGDHIGPRPYDRPDVVLGAFQEAGTFLGAARLLTERGVPTRNGKTAWQSTSVRNILERYAPAEIPPATRRGARRTGHFMFSQLLLCRCGHFLTGRHKGPTGWTGYYCQASRMQPDHRQHLSVPETAVFHWARNEASHLEHIGQDVQIGETDPEKRSTLLERRRRLGRVFADGGIDEPEYDAELVAIDAELDELDALGRWLSVPDVNWDGPPEDVNHVLRLIWRWIEMDDHQRPLRAEWTIPRWRKP